MYSQFTWEESEKLKLEGNMKLFNHSSYISQILQSQLEKPKQLSNFVEMTSFVLRVFGSALQSRVLARFPILHRACSICTKMNEVIPLKRESGCHKALDLHIISGLWHIS